LGTELSLWLLLGPGTDYQLNLHSYVPQQHSSTISKHLSLLLLELQNWITVGLC